MIKANASQEGTIAVERSREEIPPDDVDNLGGRNRDTREATAPESRATYKALHSWNDRVQAQKRETRNRAVSGRRERRTFAFLASVIGYRGVIYGKGGAVEMLDTKERVEGHYQVTETPWATDYVWVPEGEDVERYLLEEVLHPWNVAYAEWVKEDRAHPEEQARLEMEALH